MTEQEKKLLLVLLDEIARNSENASKRWQKADESIEYNKDQEAGFASGQASAYRYISRIIKGDI